MSNIAAKFHFISGLPRSGSTLLSALLRQNPRFHAGISSPVAPLLQSIISQVSAGSEFASQVSTGQRKAILKGIVSSYYEANPAEVIFDTNRSWCSSLPLLMELYPQARILACVRNLAWIMDSIERRYRSDPFEHTRLFGSNSERNSVYSRVDTLGQRDRLVGSSWTSLKEACYSEHANRLLLIDYELLARSPHQVMPLIYQFIGEPEFSHNFEQVEFDSPDFDDNLGLRGLHKVRSSVSLETRTSILPPDLFEQYAQLNFWQQMPSSAANVISVKAPE